MKHIFNIICIVCLIANGATLAGQTEKRTVQPKIMVLPRANSYQDLANAMESNPNVRLSISLIKEAFNKRGFPTVDFMAKLKNNQGQDAMEQANQSDYKQELIESSGADIYIETETIVDRTASGNNVSVIVSAFDAGTSMSLANKSFQSPRFFTESFDKLIQTAVTENIDDFMNQIQKSFDDMVVNGRLISMSITFAEGSENNMDKEFDNYELLSDKIESWLSKNAYKSYYHVQGVTASKMMVDEIRVPLTEEDGTSFRTAKFVQSFRKYLGDLGLTTTRDLKGAQIFITIQ